MCCRCCSISTICPRAPQCCGGMRVWRPITSATWPVPASEKRCHRRSPAAPPGPSKADHGDWAMRYMFLVYSRERDFAEASPQDREKVKAGHWAVMDESQRKGVFIAGEPLQPTATATTIRKENGRPLVLDGPFAETKEQLAGYYILDCKNLDEAIAWASKIPTGCGGKYGCIEIRPMPEVAASAQIDELVQSSAAHNG